MIEESVFKAGRFYPWRAANGDSGVALTHRGAWRAVRRRRSVYAFSASLRTLTTLAQHALKKSDAEKTRDALHVAFSIIANARNCLGDGDPTLGPQWHEAATRFMQDYNDNLDTYTGYRANALDDGGAE